MPPTPSDVWSPCTTPIVGNVAVPTTRNRPAVDRTVSPMCTCSCSIVAVPSTISPDRSIMRPSMIGGTAALDGSMPNTGMFDPLTSVAP